jgi:hypothetical protein
MVEECLQVSMALCCIWAWLIPHFYIEYMEYRLALMQSRGKSCATATEGNESTTDYDCTIPYNGKQIYPNEDDDSQNDRNNRDIPSSLNDANMALLRGAAAALLILVVVYTASAIGIALPTHNMDRRADAIVVGFGRILSAFLFAVFSVEIPKWLGVTYSSQRGNYYKQQVSSTTKLKELSFRVCWSILGHFFVMYGIMLLYFTNPTRWSILLSTAVGIAFGFGVIWAVYAGRTTYKNHTTLIAFVFSFVIMVSSAAVFSAGCWYIKEMWYEDDIGFQDEYTLITFFGWLFLCVIANGLYYRLTRRKLMAAATTDGNSTVGVASSAIDVDNDGAKSTWRYKAQVFQPPENVCVAATALSKATARVAVDTVRSPFISAGTTLFRMRTRSSGSLSRSGTRHEEGAVSLDDNHTFHKRRRTVSADVGTTEKLPLVRVQTVTELSVMGSSLVDSPSNNRGRSYSEISCSSSSLGGERTLLGNLNELTRASLNRSPLTGMEANIRSSLFDVPSGKTDSALKLDEAMEPNHALLYDLPQVQTSGFIFDTELPSRSSLDVEEALVEEVDDDDDGDDKCIANELEPTLWFMVQTNTCCGKRRHYKAPPRTRWEHILNVIKWTLWGITSAMHIFFLIICIGATAQQERVRTALPATFALLYPHDLVVSKMCAWNESSPEGDIRTFDSIDAVLEANYTVIHCGACGACSNWDDLSLQWTTRSNLAALGQEWYVPYAIRQNRIVKFQFLVQFTSLLFHIDLIIQRAEKVVWRDQGGCTAVQ